MDLDRFKGCNYSFDLGFASEGELMSRIEGFEQVLVLVKHFLELETCISLPTLL